MTTRIELVRASGDGNCDARIKDTHPGSFKIFSQLCRSGTALPGDAVAIAGRDRILLFMVIKDLDYSEPQDVYMVEALKCAAEWLETRGFSDYEDLLLKFK